MQGLRYNPGGLLAQGAAAVGGQARLAGQKSADLGFINDEMNRRNQIAELAQQDDLEGQKLQMAGQIANQRGQTSTTPMDGGSSSPFTTAVMQAKQLAVQNASDLDPTEHAAFSADIGNPKEGASEFNQRIQKTVQDKRNIKAKNDVLNAAKDQIDPSDQAQISAMLGDSQYGPQHVMQAIQQSAQKKQKNQQMQQDQQAKSDLWTKAQTALDKPDQLAPMVNDPRVSAQQLQQMASHQYQQEQMAKAKEKGASELTLNEQVSNRGKIINQMKKSIDLLKSSNGAIQWNAPDADSATGGDANLKPVYEHVQSLQKEMDDMVNTNKQIINQSGAQLLHSPSTGQLLHFRNGQLNEVSGADQQ